MNDFSHTAIEFTSEKVILDYSERLVGMTFRDVIELGITPDEGAIVNYTGRRYKGGLGNLLEERFFGYRANSDREPDFAKAGVELKVSCTDPHKDGKLVAGERLVLTMIPYDEEMPESVYDTHLWHKCRRILLVWYLRDRNLDTYDQRIVYRGMFTPSKDDMLVIERDYDVIAGTIRDGRAEELSESLTLYLGACTKGATAAKSRREQSLYAPGKYAKSRAFCYKRSYMDYVLKHYFMGEAEAESIAADPRELERKGLVGYVTDTINAHIGKTDRELCSMLGLEYTGNKAQWTTIAYRLLGVHGDRASEFEKASIRVRTLRPEPDGETLRESAPVLNIDFLELAREDEWEDSQLCEQLADLRYLFVVFQKVGDRTVLRGCKVWGISEADLDGPVRECWERTRDVVREGVEIVRNVSESGRVTYSNNLPGMADNPVAHVRPRAAKAAYRLGDGAEVGDVERDAEELPDGRWMTRQAFWLNRAYLLEQIADIIEK